MGKNFLRHRVLITGCAGFIGSHLARYFLTHGAHVIGIDNLSRTGSEFNLKELMQLGSNHFIFYKENILRYKQIVKILITHKPIHLVIHEAGQVAVTTSVANPRDDFNNNALGTFNMLEATRLYAPQAFFQFASTNKVYGKMEDIRVVERNGRYEYEKMKQGIAEDHTLDFHSPYGCSKGAADQYVRDYYRIYGLRTCVLRQSCIYGTRQYGMEDQGWVAWFTIASALGKPITIYGDGKQIRDLLWIDDLVDVYALCYKNADRVAGKIFNVGGGPNNTLSLLELVQLLKQAKIMHDNPAFSVERPGDQKVYVSDIRLINKWLNWKPETSVQKGLKHLIKWTVANKKILESALV